MEPASKRSPTWSTNGRLGLKRIEIYKEMAPVKNGHGIWEEKKELLILIKNLSKYKNTSSSDLTDKCYSLQIVFSYFSGTNPIYCGSYLIYWVFYL